MTILSVLYLLKYSNLSVFITVSFVLLLIDFLLYFAFRVLHVKKKLLFLTHSFLSVTIFASLYYVFFLAEYPTDPYKYHWVYFYSGTLFSLYVAKITFLFISSFGLLIKKRIRLFSAFTFFILGLIFSSLIYGIIRGRFHFEHTKHDRNVGLFPSNKSSVKIVQISDLHLGVFVKNIAEFEALIDSVNAFNPDIVVITGDMVNSFAEELKPFVHILKKLGPKYGTYGVLGNHDYGDYYRWKNPLQKKENHQLMISLLSDADITLLNNSHVQIQVKESSFYLAGIENWGLYPYRQEGNLYKALKGIPATSPVLLLSHDPVFWEKQVHKHKNIKLTLSGHTHGMQIGFRFFRKEWSPFALNKKYSSGWYQEGIQYLYINKGLGGSLYPGRVGIRPEISYFVIH